jgi:hypothetical protein
VSFDNVRIDGAGAYAVQVEAKGSATFRRVTARRLRQGGVNICGSDFAIVRAEANQGWETETCASH